MVTEEKRLAKISRLANLILCVAGICCVLLLSYFIYHYGWIRDRHFTSLVGPLLYYGLPAVSAGLCFASLRLRSSFKVNIAFLVVSAGVSVYAAEIITTIWFSLPSVIVAGQMNEKVKAAKELGVNFDARSPLQVVNDLRKKGVDAYPIFYPGNLLKELPNYGKEILPLGGLSNKVSVLCNESGEYVIYESDEHGFHNPKGLWSKGPVEIVALGDSNVQGECVPSDKNFVAQIRRVYTTTVNLGIGGYGPLLMLATIKEYAQTLRPKIVLWFYYEGNDLKNLKTESNSPLLMRYLEDGFSQGLLTRQADIDDLVVNYFETVRGKRSKRLEEVLAAVQDIDELYKKRKRILKLGQLRESLGLFYGKGQSSHGEISSLKPDKAKGSPMYEAEIDLLGQILLHAKEVVSEWGGELYFVYLPHWHRYGWPEVAEKNRDRVLLLVETIGLPVIDIHSVFQAQKDPLALFPFRQHAHYNEAGHRLVAEEVLRSISLGS